MPRDSVCNVSMQGCKGNGAVQGSHLRRPSIARCGFDLAVSLRADPIINPAIGDCALIEAKPVAMLVLVWRPDPVVVFSHPVIHIFVFTASDTPA